MLGLLNLYLANELLGKVVLYFVVRCSIDLCILVLGSVVYCCIVLCSVVYFGLCNTVYCFVMLISVV